MRVGGSATRLNALAVGVKAGTLTWLRSRPGLLDPSLLASTNRRVSTPDRRYRITLTDPAYTAGGVEPADALFGYGSTFLEIDAAGIPTQPFGTGGSVTANVV